MSLNRNKRIFLFIVLTLLYFLFFNMFTFKVHALDTGQPFQLVFRTNLDGTNASGYPGKEFSRSDMGVFKISDDYNTEQDFEYNIVSNYSDQADTRVRSFMSRYLDYIRPETNHYFVFSVYSRLELPFVGYLVQDNYNQNIGNISCEMTKSVTNSDSPHYFYNFSCNTQNINRAIYYVGIYIQNSTDRLYSPVVFGISNVFSFSNSTDALDTYNSINTITSNLTNEDVSEISQILSPNVDNFDSQLGGFSNSINGSINNSAVSGLVTLPITFLGGVSSAISGTCMPVNYIELFDYSMLLPCPNLDSRLGSVWTIIDTIFSLMLIYSIGKSLVVTFARLSDMDTNIMYECYSEGIKRRGRDIND